MSQQMPHDERMYSFVIITHGFREDRLYHLVNTIESFRYIPEREILVVGIANEKLFNPWWRDVFWVPCPELAQARTGFGRNVGVGKSCGDVVVFFDDDVEPLPGWDKAIVEFGPFGLLGCAAVRPDGKGGFERTADWGAWTAGRSWPVPYDQTHPNGYIGGGLLLVDRKVFKAGVTWDDERGPGDADDVDFCFRAKAKGFTLQVCPEARVIHHQDLRGRAKERMPTY